MKKRALVLLLPGLGDALAASPIVRALVANGYEIDALTMLKAVADYAESIAAFRSVYHLPLLTSPLSALPALYALRRQTYNVCFVPFPAARWQYAFVAAIISAKRTFIHRYGGVASSLSRMMNATEVELEGGHRVAENARLVRDFGPIDIDSYIVPREWRRTPTPSLIGLHPGTMKFKGNEARRWPVEHWIDVAGTQLKKGRSVRVFFGPHEAAERQAFSVSLGEAVDFVVAPLADAAKKLSECHVFVANDGGFSHLAAGLGTRTVALFGMTSPIRGAPLGSAIIVRPSTCVPCHDEGLRAFPCCLNIGYRCTREDLRPVHVIDAIEVALSSKDIEQKPLQRSPFRLYGRCYEGAPPLSAHGALPIIVN